MTKPRTFRATITDLTPGTIYYFRAKAVGGSTSYGEEMTFTTKTRGRWWNKLFDEIFNRLMRLFRLPW